MAAPVIAATRAPQAIVESEEFPGLAGLDANHLSKAETAIRSCLAGETSNLLLNYLELVTLPGSTIGRIGHLEGLTCAHNHLTELPSELGKCAKLQRIYCNYNLLTELPSELGKCTELQALFCADNRLTNLPPELGKCVKLRTMCCTDNRIEELPAEFGELAELVNLSCTNNRLESLPPELGNCPKLQMLYCGENPLVEGTLHTPDELRAQWAARPHTKSAART